MATVSFLVLATMLNTDINMTIKIIASQNVDVNVIRHVSLEVMSHLRSGWNKPFDPIQQESYQST